MKFALCWIRLLPL